MAVGGMRRGGRGRWVGGRAYCEAIAGNGEEDALSLQRRALLPNRSDALGWRGEDLQCTTVGRSRRTASKMHYHGCKRPERGGGGGGGGYAKTTCQTGFLDQLHLELHIPELHQGTPGGRWTHVPAAELSDWRVRIRQSGRRGEGFSARRKERGVSANCGSQVTLLYLS